MSESSLINLILNKGGITIMIRQEILCSCGHKAIIPLNGSDVACFNKAKWYESKGLCPDCFNQKYPYIAEGHFKEVCMHYRKFKEEFSDCKTKYGSYDDADKTIVVYVPD